MPTLETIDGKPVDADAINAQFSQAMNSEPANEQAPPKRQPTPAPEGAPAAAAKPRRGRPPKGDQARTTAAPPAEATAEVTAKRATNVSETFQIVGGALGMLGKSTNSAALKADGYLCAHMAPSLGAAAAEVAKYEPAFARWMDNPAGGKVAAYTALFACVASIGTQVAVNHGMLKPGLMGSVAPEEIIEAYERADAEETAEAEAETATDAPAEA